MPNSHTEENISGRGPGFCCPLGHILVPLLLTPAALGQPVADEDTLLLVQFDRGVDAEFSRGSPQGESTGELVPGRFGKGIELRPGQRVRFVGDDGNFNPSEGTIEFWVKPHWVGEDRHGHSFFTCRLGPRCYINVNTIGRGTVGIAIAAGDGPQWRWRRAEAGISSWRPEQWHHLACSWGNGQLHVFVDGREGRRRVADARMPDKAPERLELLGADAVIDALRISRRMFTAADVQRSIQQALGPAPYRYLDQLPCQPADGCAADSRHMLGDVRVPLVLAGAVHARRFAQRPGQELSVTLGGRYHKFQAAAGLDAFSPSAACCSFQVIGDGRPLFDSGPCRPGQPAVQVDVPVDGVRTLVLRLVPVGRVPAATLGVWADAVVSRAGARPVLAVPRRLKPAELDMYRRQLGADNYTFTPPVGGLLLTAAKFWVDEIDPASPPPPDRIGQTLSGFATPGEYEPLSFVLYAVRDLKQVRVRVSELRCGQSVIPSDQVGVRLVLRGLMRDLYVLPPERSTVVSRFLLSNRPVDVPAGTFREFHLTVHVPERAAAGTYGGRVRIEPAGLDPVALPVEFQVLPFRFRPLERKFYGIYYRFPADEADWQRCAPELADLRAHGVTTMIAPFGVRFERAEDGGLNPSLERLRHGLDLLRRFGFHGPLPVGSGCEQAARLLGYDPVKDYADQRARQRFLSAVKRAMDQLVELGRQYPEFELLPTHMDEVFGRGRLERYIRLTEAVRQVKSLRVYITLHNSPRAGVADMMRRCDPFVDVRCYNGHAMDDWLRAGHRFNQLRDELERAGDRAWVYYNIRGSFFKPEWTRLVNGFYLWVSPLQAHVPWMYYSVKGNPLDETDGPRRGGHDFVYAVPDPTRPGQLVWTRHWEAFREGIDDMRYLCTLEDLIAERPRSKVAAQARQWLDRLRVSLRPDPARLQQIEQESPVLISLARQFDGPDYRRFRLQAAGYIKRLISEPP